MAAELHDVRCDRQATIEELQVAQLASDRIHPERAHDVDSATLAGRWLEQQSYFVRTRTVAVSQPEAVPARKPVIEQDVGVGSVEHLGLRIEEATLDELRRRSRCCERPATTAGIPADYLSEHPRAGLVQDAIEDEALGERAAGLARYDAGEQAGLGLLPEAEGCRTVTSLRAVRLVHHADRLLASGRVAAMVHELPGGMGGS